MEVGSINYIDINEEMRSSYLDYAMSVIVARALPDARDGLKPVHRRILYAMHDMGIRANSPHRKSARIVGEVLGKYHPHGDSSVYEAMVRMAQSFSLRYPLVDGQGNFGSIDGDRAAAMRYTEARLAKITSIVMEDIDKNTVEFEDNFDGAEREPTVLPAELPNLLLNGTSGIAVGMSTNIPPHNLTEVCNALVYMIDNQDKYDDISVDDLMQFITAPDFPTGGQIVGTAGVKAAYATGRGRVVMRGVGTVEDMPGKKNRQRINITEIPYQVNKSSLIERIAELANKGVLVDVSDLRDESDRNGMSIIVEIKQGRQPMKVLNQLYKHTTLQSTFGVQMLALVDRQPKMLPLKRALQIYIDHRTEIKTRSTQFDLDKALARHHILEGLLIAINNLDAVIKTIRESPSADAARTNLMTGFDLSERQAQAILDMQLRRLAALERQKIEDEFNEINKTIAYLQDLLDNKSKILDLIREEVLALIEKYGDERRTEIVQGDGEFFDEDMIQDKDVLVSISRRGYMKRTPVAAYRLQSRGGKGLIGAGTKDEDELEHLFMAGSLNTLLCFTNQGKVYAIKTYEIPELDRTAKGTSVMNILPLTPEEKVTVVLPVPNFDDAEYLTMITNFGRIKRVALSAFKKVRANGLIALNLDDGDSLNWVKMTAGDEDLLLVSEKGQGIRFSEEDVRPMGRTAAGVNAMKLSDGDTLAGADIASEEDFLLVITEKGMGKRTQVSEFRRQNRYGGGMRAMVLKKADDKVVASRVVSLGDQVTCISTNGIILRTSIDEISQQGRATQGVRVMDLREDDIVASVAVVRPRLIEEAEVDAEGNPVVTESVEGEDAVVVAEEAVDTVETEETAQESEEDADAEA